MLCQNAAYALHHEVHLLSDLTDSDDILSLRNDCELQFLDDSLHRTLAIVLRESFPVQNQVVQQVGSDVVSEALR